MIDRRLERAVMREVLLQCDLAQQAYLLFTENLASLLEPISSNIAEIHANRDQHMALHTRTFLHAHAVLTHAANLSKLLQPGRAFDKTLQAESDARGAWLQQVLGVQSTALVLDRDLRNDVEHFDERLHAWFRDMQGQPFVDSNIGGPGAIQVGQAATQRNLDPDTGDFSFQSHTVRLPDLLREVDLLRLAAEAWFAANR